MTMRFRHVVGALLLAVALAALLGLFAKAPPVAEAGLATDLAKESLSSLVKYVRSGRPTNLKLLALEQLRLSDVSGVDTELRKIAEDGDLRIAIYATTFIGKRKTSGSKGALKTLVENGKVRKEVRQAAMTAVATHFKDADDLTWMWTEAQDNAVLKAHYLWLKRYVYEK